MYERCNIKCRIRWSEWHVPVFFRLTHIAASFEVSFVAPVASAELSIGTARRAVVTGVLARGIFDGGGGGAAGAEAEISFCFCLGFGVDRFCFFRGRAGPAATVSSRAPLFRLRGEAPAGAETLFCFFPFGVEVGSGAGADAASLRAATHPAL